MSTSRRIACFLPALEGGGAERVFLTLVKGFLARGHEVDLVLSRKTGALLSDIPSGARLFNLDCHKVARSLWPLRSYLRKERPVALLTGLSNANVVGVWARILAQVPTRTVVSVHSHLTNSTAGSRSHSARLAAVAARLSYPLADSVVAVSEGVAADLASSFSVPSEKTTVIHNPVVDDAVDLRAAEALSHPWFAPGQPPVILSAGRLVPAKDYPMLLDAFSLLRARREARLVILGEGPEREDLERRARSLGVASDVQMPGFVANPYPYMRRSRVFALSSQWEGFGNVIAEALAVGTTVVSTDCRSGPSEILDDGRFGSLVPVGDPAAMAAAMGRALSTPVDPAELMERGRSFSVASAVDRYLSVLLPASHA